MTARARPSPLKLSSRFNRGLGIGISWRNDSSQLSSKLHYQLARAHCGDKSAMEGIKISARGTTGDVGLRWRYLLPVLLAWSRGGSVLMPQEMMRVQLFVCRNLHKPCRTRTLVSTRCMGKLEDWVPGFGVSRESVVQLRLRRHNVV